MLLVYPFLFVASAWPKVVIDRVQGLTFEPGRAFIDTVGTLFRQARCLFHREETCTRYPLHMRSPLDTDCISVKIFNVVSFPTFLSRISFSRALQLFSRDPSRQLTFCSQVAEAPPKSTAAIMWTSGDLPWALAGTRHWDLHWPAMFAVASALFAATFALDSTTNTSRYDNFNPLTQTCYLTFSRGELKPSQVRIFNRLIMIHLLTHLARCLHRRHVLHFWWILPGPAKSKQRKPSAQRYTKRERTFTQSV